MIDHLSLIKRGSTRPLSRLSVSSDIGPYCLSRLVTQRGPFLRARGGNASRIGSRAHWRCSPPIRLRRSGWTIPFDQRCCRRKAWHGIKDADQWPVRPPFRISTQPYSKTTDSCRWWYWWWHGWRLCAVERAGIHGLYDCFLRTLLLVEIPNTWYRPTREP
jgi:hypothetical protein